MAATAALECGDGVLSGGGGVRGERSWVTVSPSVSSSFSTRVTVASGFRMP